MTVKVIIRNIRARDTESAAEKGALRKTNAAAEATTAPRWRVPIVNGGGVMRLHKEVTAPNKDAAVRCAKRFMTEGKMWRIDVPNVTRIN